MLIYRSIISVALVCCGMVLVVGTAVADERKATLAVEGMTCSSCPYMVEKALQGVDGVKSAEASLKEERALVRYDAAETAPEALTQATENAGFPSKVVETQP